MLKIQIIIGSTREGRRSESVAKWLYSVARKRSDAQFELVDLRDYPLPFYNEPGSPQGLKDEIPTAKKWRDKVLEADGYIIVSPEYNHGYTAVLKNALDYVYKAWNKKAVTFISYGAVGGARAIEQLRLVAVELQMAPMHTTLAITGVTKLINEDGTINDPSYEDRATRLLDNLIWWSNVLKKAREESKTS
jgi:NAD(P)H-dependent FMN reductase